MNYTNEEMRMNYTNEEIAEKIKELNAKISNLDTESNRLDSEISSKTDDLKRVLVRDFEATEKLKSEIAALDIDHAKLRLTVDILKSEIQEEINLEVIKLKCQEWLASKWQGTYEHSVAYDVDHKIDFMTTDVVKEIKNLDQEYSSAKSALDAIEENRWTLSDSLKSLTKESSRIIEDIRKPRHILNGKLGEKQRAQKQLDLFSNLLAGIAVEKKLIPRYTYSPQEKDDEVKRIALEHVVFFRDKLAEKRKIDAEIETLQARRQSIELGMKKHSK